MGNAFSSSFIISSFIRRDVLAFPSPGKHKNWLIKVYKTPKVEILCKCQAWLLLLSLSKEHQIVSSLCAQLDLQGWNRELHLNAQELPLDGLHRHSRQASAMFPELLLFYSLLISFSCLYFTACKSYHQGFQWVASIADLLLVLLTPPNSPLTPKGTVSLKPFSKVPARTVVKHDRQFGSSEQGLRKEILLSKEWLLNH